MGLRIPQLLVAVVVMHGFFSDGTAFGWGGRQWKFHRHQSLEWQVVDSDLVVRGVVADVVVARDREPDKAAAKTYKYDGSDRAPGGNAGGGYYAPGFADATPGAFPRYDGFSVHGYPSKTVTIEVRETLKGDKADRRQFMVQVEATNDSLERWKTSKEEVLCFLQRNSNRPGEFLLRNTGNYYFSNSIFSDATMFSLDAKASEGKPRLFSIELQIPSTPDEILKTVRTAVALERGRKRVQSYDLPLPAEIAVRSGGKATVNYLVLPRDERLESLARRLIESPADFLAQGDKDLTHELRMEGIKALRLFKTEKNLALLRSWLDDPQVKTKYPAGTPLEALVPQRPRGTPTRSAIPSDLAAVPEVYFQQPLTKALSIADAQLRTACTIDFIHFVNQRKTDAFMEALLRQRSDLAGLPFVLGDACRMKDEARQRFVGARKDLQDAIQKADNPTQLLIFPPVVEGAGERHRYMPLPPKDRLEVYEEVESANANKTDAPARVATLMQMCGPEDAKTRLGLVKYFDGKADAVATRALARLVIFSEESDIRQAAVRALKLRRDSDYADVLIAGLNYPWPQVAQRSSAAIAELGRTDLIPHLLDVLERPDPRAPNTQEVQGKQTTVVRELVRINHHHNCLLCHAPATSSRDNASKEETDRLAPLTAQIPVPSEAFNAYYSPNLPDILVRFDVTYLRQDFSMNLPVADAAPWPEMQRYDFLVRSRTVSADEARTYQEMLPKQDESPYRRAAQSAVRRLTGRDAEPTIWRVEENSVR